MLIRCGHVLQGTERGNGREKKEKGKKKDRCEITRGPPNCCASVIARSLREIARLENILTRRIFAMETRVSCNEQSSRPTKIARVIFSLPDLAETADARTALIIVRASVTMFASELDFVIFLPFQLRAELFGVWAKMPEKIS